MALYKFTYLLTYFVLSSDLKYIIVIAVIVLVTAAVVVVIVIIIIIISCTMLAELNLRCWQLLEWIGYVKSGLRAQG